MHRETDGRFIASVSGVPGCHVYGLTRHQAIRRVRSALAFYLEQTRRGRQGEDDDTPRRQAAPATSDGSTARDQCLGMAAEFWLGLQQDWDLWHAMRGTASK